MNHLDTLPQPKRFFSALVCLPLMWLIVTFFSVGMKAAGSSLPLISIVGFIGIVAALKMQRIAAWIVTFTTSFAKELMRHYRS